MQAAVKTCLIGDPHNVRLARSRNTPSLAIGWTSRILLLEEWPGIAAPELPQVSAASEKWFSANFAALHSGLGSAAATVYILPGMPAGPGQLRPNARSIAFRWGRFAALPLPTG